MIKRIAKATGIGITILVVLLYLLSALGGYVSPVEFPLITLFTTFYLPILALFILMTVLWMRIRMKFGLLLILIFFAGIQTFFHTVAFNLFSGRWEAQKKTGEVRIMCWNLNRMGSAYPGADTPGSRRRQVLDFIAGQAPDILCLQDFAQDERLVDGRNYFVNNINDMLDAGGFAGYAYFYHFEYDGPSYCDMIGPAIFSKFPIIDTGSFQKNGALPIERSGFADILVHGRRLRVFSAHLSSMSLWPNSTQEAGIRYLEGDSTRIKARGIFSRIVQYGKYHAQEAEVIRRVADASPYPVLISADLNSVPGAYVYRQVRGNLNDAFLQNDFGIGGTYNRVFPKLRIDLMFHSDEITVTQFTRPAVDLSDHYPLIADFKWKE